MILHADMGKSNDGWSLDVLYRGKNVIRPNQIVRISGVFSNIFWGGPQFINN